LCIYYLIIILTYLLFTYYLFVYYLLFIYLFITYLFIIYSSFIYYLLIYFSIIIYLFIYYLLFIFFLIYLLITHLFIYCLLIIYLLSWNQDRLATTMTALKGWTLRVSDKGTKKILSSPPKRRSRLRGLPIPLLKGYGGLFPQVYSGWIVKVTTVLSLVYRLTRQAMCV